MPRGGKPQLNEEWLDEEEDMKPVLTTEGSEKGVKKAKKDKKAKKSKKERDEKERKTKDEEDDVTEKLKLSVQGGEEDEEKLQRCKVILLLGGPGSGVKIQAKNLAEKFNLLHISFEDLLLEKAGSATSTGNQIKEAIKKGNPLPTDVIVMVLLEKLVNHLDTHRDFLITGFPQNIDQAMEFDKQAVCPTHVIHINCSTGTRMTRLLIRKELQQSYMKDEASLKKRMYDYFKTIDSIINYYRISSHVKEINGEKELERVFKKCCKTLTSVLKCRC